MEEPPSNSPLVCSASQGLADHPIGLSTAPALIQFVHCALTLQVYTRVHIQIDTHTLHSWRLNRYSVTHRCSDISIHARKYGTHQHAIRKHSKGKITVRPPGTRAVTVSRVCVDLMMLYGTIFELPKNVPEIIRSYRSRVKYCFINCIAN